MLNRTITNLKVALATIAQFDPIRPIEMISPPEQRLVPKHQYANEWLPLDPHTGRYYDRVGPAKAINLDTVGRGPIGRYEPVFDGETEEHLAGVIEALDGHWGMSYHDVVNQANVY
jgi:hypothetical protein